MSRSHLLLLCDLANNFLYISGVPRSIAHKLLPYLNVVGEHHLSDSSSSATSPDAESARLEHIYRQSLVHAQAAFEASDSRGDKSAHLTPGYVTLDRCDDLGDDTLHRPLPATWQPIFVSTAFPEPRWRPTSFDEEQKTQKPAQEQHEAEEVLDVVFFDFIQPDILSALNTLQDVREYTPADVQLYVDSLSANTLMQEYALRKWN